MHGEFAGFSTLYPHSPPTSEAYLHDAISHTIFVVSKSDREQKELFQKFECSPTIEWFDIVTHLINF